MLQLLGAGTSFKAAENRGEGNYAAGAEGDSAIEVEADSIEGVSVSSGEFVCFVNGNACRIVCVSDSPRVCHSVAIFFICNSDLFNVSCARFRIWLCSGGLCRARFPATDSDIIRSVRTT